MYFLKQEKWVLLSVLLVVIIGLLGPDSLVLICFSASLILLAAAFFDFFMIHKALPIPGALWIFLVYSLALIPRLVMFNFESGDYTGNLSIWYDVLKQGGFSSLKQGFHEYPPAYLYLMYFMSLSALPKLWAIKLISVFFDYVLAWAVFKLVRIKFSNKTALTASIISLFLPTVLFNGALWAQCDSLYTSFLLLALVGFIRKNYRGAMIWYALAFVFKIQAVFFILVPLTLYAGKKFRFQEFLWIPVLYCLSIVPNWLAGRPLSELLLIYVNQSGIHDSLSSFAPNLYQWLSWAPNELFTQFGILFCAAIIGIYFLGMLRIQMHLNAEILIQIALLSTLFLPFFLPRMHDRYFFPADVLALVYAFYFPKRWLVPVLVVSASFFCYIYFLFSTLTVFPFPILTAMMALALLFVIKDFIHTLIQNTHAIDTDTPGEPG